MWDSSDSDARIATFRTATDAVTSGGHRIVAERPKDTALVRQAIAEGGWASVWAKAKRLVRRSKVRASRRQQACSSTSACASKSFSTHARDSGEHARVRVGPMRCSFGEMLPRTAVVFCEPQTTKKPSRCPTLTRRTIGSLV